MDDDDDDDDDEWIFVGDFKLHTEVNPTEWAAHVDVLNYQLYFTIARDFDLHFRGNFRLSGSSGTLNLRVKIMLKDDSRPSEIADTLSFRPDHRTSTIEWDMPNDHMTIQVTVCVFRYAGLINGGATCYANAVLQCIFHLPAVRNIVYGLRHVGGDVNWVPVLIRLFANMQLHGAACPTDDVTRTLGGSGLTERFTRMLTNSGHFCLAK
jgi:hypothetical protein